LSGTLFGADERQLALALRAQSDFDRVELALHPQIQQTNACAQSQASVIPVALRSELASLYFRKGYCALVGATLTRRPSDFLEAAADFRLSLESLPAAIGHTEANSIPQPVSSGLRILQAVSKLQAEPVADRLLKAELTAAVERPVCASSVM